jgi:glutamyl-tRNA synthetase
MKLYKQSPESYKGSVADVCMFLRVAVTGKLNAPDLHTVMQILGKEKVNERIEKMINSL